jgi:RNA polymerase sigma factor (sigma-70 family)
VSLEDYLPRFRDDGHPVRGDLSARVLGIEDEAIARELAERAEEFIAELPPAYRDVIWMVDVEEMKPADVAETLEISIPALKSRLHRARLFVRQRLTEASAARAGERRAAP